MRLPKHFTLFETTLIVLFAVLATRTLVRQHDLRHGGASLVEPPLLEMLEERFGRERYSMGLEEWFIRDFFDDATGLTFVDVGAWEPKRGSNTYRLERDLQWSGLAIDALEELATSYARDRPRTRFVVAFVGPSDDGNAVLHVPDRLTEVASGDASFVRVFAQRTTTRSVRRRTLDSLLAEAGAERVDLLSVDIETGEPAALAAFSIARFRPRLAVIEAQGSTRQAILDYFAANHYVLVGRYLPYDRVNLYFMPRASQSPVGGER